MKVRLAPCSNLPGAEEQVLPGDADQEERVQLFKVLRAQGEPLHAGEVQLRSLLQQRRGLLLPPVLPGRQEGLEENQHLWRQAQVWNQGQLGSVGRRGQSRSLGHLGCSLLKTGRGRRVGGHTSGATRAPREL